MNGNDLNNMTKRYKDEMMQLYRRCAKNQTSQSNSVRSPEQNCSQSPAAVSVTQETEMCRTVCQTPMNHMPMQHTPVQAVQPVQPIMNSEKTYDQCHGRETTPFPSAETIMQSMQSAPVVYSSSVSSPAAIPAQESVSDGNASSELKGIIFNMFPTNATYAYPMVTDSENEVYPSFVMPSDIPADSVQAVPDTRGFFPSQAWIAITGDNSWGFFQAEVFESGQEYYPIAGALVLVKKSTPSGTVLLRALVTNNEGLTPTIALPAPKTMGLTADSVTPFSDYSVTVIANGYYTLRNVNAAVYAGTKTVQPVAMIPIPASTPIQPRSDAAGSIG